ncbi:MAG: Fur family transcriptional regulator [Candidatus Saelkia tenebricola]|nr:Fur family transcriptional regulator [Candidatus Saelkia tenebricola]
MQMKTIFNYNQLQKKGYKLTPQRKIVIEILVRETHHLSADEIYLKVKRVYPRIGLTTVYRTLDVLSELGWVRRCDFGEGKARYEFAENFSKNNKHHHHIVCIKCNAVIDYADFVDKETELIKASEINIAEKYDFNVQWHSVRFYGICRKCAKNDKK